MSFYLCFATFPVSANCESGVYCIGHNPEELQDRLPSFTTVPHAMVVRDVPHTRNSCDHSSDHTDFLCLNRNASAASVSYKGAVMGILRRDRTLAAIMFRSSKY